jgi:hypothetical protein
LAAGKISLAPEQSGDISALMYELTNSVIEMSGNTSHFGPLSKSCKKDLKIWSAL